MYADKNSVYRSNLLEPFSLLFISNSLISFVLISPGGYNMVSGKTLYYNSLKNENNKVNTSVTLANGKHATKTVLLPRTSIHISGQAPVHSRSQEKLTLDTLPAKNKNTISADISGNKINGDLKSSLKSSESNITMQNETDISEENITSTHSYKNGVNNKIVRKGSITSECSSSYSNTNNSLNMDTPKHLQRFSCALRKSFALDECNSEISFLSETTRNSTPISGSPNLRTNSLRFKKENTLRSFPLQEVSVKSNPDLRKSLIVIPPDHIQKRGSPQSSDTAHILTIRNSQYETVPLGLSQDIPDVFL